jgi:hypothetical protein
MGQDVMLAVWERKLDDLLIAAVCSFIAVPRAGPESRVRFSVRTSIEALVTSVTCLHCTSDHNQTCMLAVTHWFVGFSHTGCALVCRSLCLEDRPSELTVTVRALSQSTSYWVNLAE